MFRGNVPELDHQSPSWHRDLRTPLLRKGVSHLVTILFDHSCGRGLTQIFDRRRKGQSPTHRLLWRRLEDGPLRKMLLCTTRSRNSLTEGFKRRQIFTCQIFTSGHNATMVLERGTAKTHATMRAPISFVVGED